MIEIVENIIQTNIEISRIFPNPRGWAPDSAADLLENSMLEWQVDLSECLKIWVSKKPLSDGDLILAWANLGSLLEGSIKLFLCVYIDDYKEGKDKIIRYKKEISPNESTLSPLIDVLEKKALFNEYINFFTTVKNNRNIIHSFNKKKLGNDLEFYESLKEYSDFLSDLHCRLPDHN